MRKENTVRTLTLAAALAVTTLTLAGCGESAKEQAVKAGAAGSAEQLKERLRSQADR